MLVSASRQTTWKTVSASVLAASKLPWRLSRMKVWSDKYLGLGTGIGSRSSNNPTNLCWRILFFSQRGYVTFRQINTYRIGQRKLTFCQADTDNGSASHCIRNPGLESSSIIIARDFSSVSLPVAKRPKMSAKLISGTEVSKEIKEQLRQEVAQMKQLVPDFLPGLRIVQVGNREDSNVYIRMKIKAATEIGMVAELVKLPRTITEIELLEELNKLNCDPKVHGIIVQMPLDTESKIDSHKITDAVDPSKDVDGLCTINEGRVAVGELNSGFMPCTPYGCIELIKRSGIKIEGAKAVVLGRSKIVGTPVAELLKWHNATVTVCHSKTKDIASEVRQADILVVKIGRPEMVKGDWVKPGAVVVDCGINAIPVSMSGYDYIPDSTKKSGQRLVGDVDFKEVSQVASYITPVPGGVGPMTVCMLMKNTVISAAKSLSKITGQKWDFTPLPLAVKEPVPR